VNDLDWARDSAAYLQRAQQRADSNFKRVVELFNGGHYVAKPWFGSAKGCAKTLHRLSLELVDDATIPGRSFNSPQDLVDALDAYETSVRKMQDSLADKVGLFTTETRGRTPYEAQELRDLLRTQLAIVRHVRSTAPSRFQSTLTSRQVS
jgi:hypothetical protein